jgi:LAO/AO transport system kinase
MRGKIPEKPESKKSVVRRKELSVEEYVNGVLQGDRTILARTITLIESNSLSHIEKAQEVLAKIMPRSGKSLRIGITGVPGAGKSTFIESFGLFLIEKGHRVAVLAVDPTSSVSGGSILGDKTRMEKLSARKECFIRPSPSGGALGGVARKTRESILVCEAAGFDIILVETVGVGQNEITVRSMVDFFLLLQIAGGGDELQGIKKGVMELADAIAVNKADGDNRTRADLAAEEYRKALHYTTPFSRGWQPPVFTCSALRGTGIDEIWTAIIKYSEITRKNGFFSGQRQRQQIEWFHSMIKASLENLFYQSPAIKEKLRETEQQISVGRAPVTAAVRQLLELFEKNLKK